MAQNRECVTGALELVFDNFKIYMRFDHFQILMMLLEAGAQPDSKDAENRYRYKKRIFLLLSILRTNKNCSSRHFKIFILFIAILIFHVNHLPADDSCEISSLFF